MTSRSAQRFDFPLPERYVPRVQVTSEQHEELRSYAIRLAKDVLRNGPSWARTNVNAAKDRGWKVVTKTGEKCFMMKVNTSVKQPKQCSRSYDYSSNRRRASSLGSAPSGYSDYSVQETGGGGAGGRGFMGYIRRPGYTLDDVVTQFYCPNTRTQREQMTKTYGSSYLDGGVLATLESAKPCDPFWYLGLKWAAIRSPMEKLVNHREFTYLEHTGSFVNGHGQRMLYRILCSVNLNEYGGEKSYYGLTRGHLESASVFWMEQVGPQDDTGVLTVCSKGLVHPKGKVPLWLTERYVQRFWQAGWTCHAVGTDPCTNRLLSSKSDGLTMQLATAWVADEERSACFVCQKKFGFARRRRHHCRACGEVVCRACTQYLRLIPPTSENVTSMQYELIQEQSRRVHSYSVDADEWYDDSQDLATLGGPPITHSQRGRQRVGSENDLAMLGKVCRRCIELKKVQIRRATTYIAPKYPSCRGQIMESWQETISRRGVSTRGHKTISTQEATNRQDELPMLPSPHDTDDEEDTDAEPESEDGVSSEYSIDDMEGSFNPYATITLSNSTCSKDRTSEMSEGDSMYSFGVDSMISSGHRSHPHLSMVRDEYEPRSKRSHSAEQDMMEIINSSRRNADIARMQLQDLLNDEKPEKSSSQTYDSVLNLKRSMSAPPLPQPVRLPPPSLPTEEKDEFSLSFSSFASFDPDMLIDDTAMSYDRHGITTRAHEDEQVFLARIQNIQDEVLRQQLLSSSRSSVASSFSVTPVKTSLPIKEKLMRTSSETSTASSSESRVSPMEPLYRTQKARLSKVEQAIADQARLLFQIQQERARVQTN